MADIITIATRRISGTGKITLSDEELKLRRYTLYADIIRKQRTPYFNRRYEPPQTFYGYISLVKSGYLLETFPIKYDAQIWSFDADISGQNMVAIKCMYLGLLQSFVNLGTAQGLNVISVVNTIADYAALPLCWDEIHIKCDADCALQFTLFGLPYDACLPEYKSTANSPIAPAKPAPISPGVATNISPPYSSNDTITDPAPIDKTYVAPPQGNACQRYVISLIYQKPNTEATTFNQNVTHYGKIGRVRINPANNLQIQLECQGDPSYQGCLPFNWYVVYTDGAGFTSVAITNIVAE